MEVMILRGEKIASLKKKEKTRISQACALSFNRSKTILDLSTLLWISPNCFGQEQMLFWTGWAVFILMRVNVSMLKSMNI